MFPYFNMDKNCLEKKTRRNFIKKIFPFRRFMHWEVVSRKSMRFLFNAECHS